MITKLQEQLAVRLGGNLPLDWWQAYEATPRHFFLPDRAYRSPDASNDQTVIDRNADPDGWLEAAYSEDIIVTQFDEQGKPTSSCSMPYMVFRMLDHLAVEPGMTVLEIGTGTGWNAGLLAARLGDDHVYTIEVDPQVADVARVNLAKLHREPTVITGDGVAGWEAGGPYDRVIATCTVHRVPYSWVAQTKPGGVVLTPWGTALGSGALLRLTTAEDGSASGGFVETSAFMWLREQRFTAPDEPEDFAEHAVRSTAVADVRDALSVEALFVAGVLVPGCKLAFDRDDEGYVEKFWLMSDGSWASVTPEGDVRQLGPRSLWDEVESAYAWWTEIGKPGFDRFGLTVTSEGQSIWLDRLDNVLLQG